MKHCLQALNLARVFGNPLFDRCSQVGEKPCKLNPEFLILGLVEAKSKLLSKIVIFVNSEERLL